jgi:DNA-binding CsgD family transcriptional regulator
MARHGNLPDLAADAATTLARLDERAGNPAASEAALNVAIEVARSGGEATAELRGLFNLGSLFYEQGRLVEALAVYRETWSRARTVGLSWGPYGLDARARTAIAAHVMGDWQLAAESVDFSGESPPEMAEAMLSAVALEVAAGRGDLAALGRLPRLRPWWQRDGLIAIISGAGAIDLFGLRGDIEAAQSLHDDVVETVADLWRQPEFQARIRLAALLLGQCASAAGHASRAEREDLCDRGDRLAASAAEVFSHGRRRPGPESRAWLARVGAEQSRLHWLSGIDPAPEAKLVESWQVTTAAFEDFGHAYEAARSRARLASVLQASGRSAEALEEIARARAVAERLEAGPLLSELDAIAGGTKATGGKVDPVGSRLYEPLTPREEEVLALVAAGRSNREVGLQLFISAKTVSVHVSNILAKLGAGGRTEAAAIARRRGLLPGGPGS